MRDLLLQARKEILINKDCDKALRFINRIDQNKLSNQSEKIILKRTLALVHLENNNYQASAEVFREINDKYQEGFCFLLMGNEEQARNLWYSAPDSMPKEWGKCVLEYINLKRDREPTFLMVRNFLEFDIGYFIQANKMKYAENLIRQDDILASANIEAYKLIGRALINYGFLNMARKYLVKSLEMLPNDIETMYFLAQYNFMIGAYKEAASVLENCVANNYYYLPAKNLLTKVRECINKQW
jgi:tetratricopeptide (TPR) repeat protein